MTEEGIYLDEGPLGELLVDLRFVHDVLGSAGVLQRAQGLLHRDKQQRDVTEVCSGAEEHACMSS